MCGTAVVIGHTTGLGGAVVDLLLERGNQVVGFARSVRQPHPNLHQYTADLSVLTDLDRIVDVVLQEHSDFDKLVIAAGALSAHAPGEAEYTDVEYVFRVNALAPFHLMGRLLGQVKANGADVVTVSSSSVAEYYPKLGTYSASKAALIKMTDDLRSELKATSARVIEICPSGFTSNLYSTMRGDKIDRDESVQIDVADLARLVVFSLDLPKRMEVGRVVINRK